MASRVTGKYLAMATTRRVGTKVHPTYTSPHRSVKPFREPMNSFKFVPQPAMNELSLLNKTTESRSQAKMPCRQPGTIKPVAQTDSRPKAEPTGKKSCGACPDQTTCGCGPSKKNPCGPGPKETKSSCRPPKKNPCEPCPKETKSSCGPPKKNPCGSPCPSGPGKKCGKCGETPPDSCDCKPKSGKPGKGSPCSPRNIVQPK